MAPGKDQHIITKPNISSSFYKIILDPSASRIRLPPNFTSRFKEKLVPYCELKAHEKSFYVNIEKNEEFYYFTNGWLNFVEANDLKVTDFLHFQLNQETSVFLVSMFGPNCCEKPYVTLKGSKTATDSSYYKKLRHVKVNKKAGDDALWLSFSVTFKNLNYTKCVIPGNFALRTGIANQSCVMLVVERGKRWKVGLQPKLDGSMKMTKGWDDFQRAMKVDHKVTITFRFVKGSANVLQVKLRRTKGRPQPQIS